MEMTLVLFLIFVGVGLAAGFLAGFVGVGGGIIMVPVLLEVFRQAGYGDNMLVQMSMATSLSVAVFSVLSSIVRHHRQGKIRWSLVRWLAPGSLLGGWLAAGLATRLPGHWLQYSLAGLMVFAAFRMIRSKDLPAGHEHPVNPVLALLTGLGVGLVAGLSGVAGGIVLVPAMGLLLGVPGNRLAGTSSGTIVFSALAATFGYMTSQPPVDPGPGFVGYACLGLTVPLALGAIPAAQLGGWVNSKVGGNLFRRVFGIILLLVVLRMVTT